MRPALYSILLLGLIAAVAGCGRSSSFQYLSLGDALGIASPDGDLIVPDLIDTDGDGTPDAIDKDGDGTPDTTIDPTTIPPPPTSDPIEVRDPTTEKCVLSSKFAFVNVSKGGTFTYASISGAEDLWIQMASSKGTATINLSGVTGLKRVFIDHQGGTNRIILKNANMLYGVCNEVSGGSNSERFEASNSAKIADLLSGTGGGNSIDLDFIPTSGLRYSLSGNGHCISYESATAPVTEVSNNNNNQTIHADGTNCI